MELKPYQQTVISDLDEFLKLLDETEHLKSAYEKFWNNRGVELHDFGRNNYLKPYDNSIKGVPRVTVKVPTAGGKTFIACNALRTIFDRFPLDKPKVVVWLVPSDTILQQTVKNLSDTSHPYRQKIDSHFGSAVKIYEKEALLQGASFGPTEVKEQLSILILSVSSFSANNKDSRKAFQENGNLQQFPKTYQQSDRLMPNVDETALMNVINQLSPVVIVDESHNVESGLRIEMLNNINPSFILDLTATPREKSNIISFVDAIHLKKSNMVKLPVIVYNHHDANEVISGAINLQKTLEAEAITEEKNGGKYIRPIVLLQAQPKNNSDNITFEKIKEHLIASGISAEQVKIKTSGKDEISKEDLMSRECKVRFIITVNALKEGWDCPFAYILASLANKSSAIDVEQILGRILRQPYVCEHKQELLNYSFVLTSSSNFIATLDKIIEGLNKSGFSEKDYRTKDAFIVDQTSSANTEPIEYQDLFKQKSAVSEPIEITAQINPETIKENSTSEKAQNQLNEIINLATQTNEKFEKTIKQLDQEDIIPNELANSMKTYQIRDKFKEEVENLRLPQFFIRVNQGSIFNPQESLEKLSKNLLLKDFPLSQKDREINFNETSTEIYSVDLVEAKKDEYVPEYKKEKNVAKEEFIKYILGLQPEGRINQLAGRILKQLRGVDAIPESELLKYIKSVLGDQNSDTLADLSHNELRYARCIEDYIQKLSSEYAKKRFDNLLEKGEIVCQEHFMLPKVISPINTMKGITKNLYEQEGEMNDLEKKVINEIANLDNVVFWHRNLERGKGFFINGFLNMYPDFIVKTKSGKIVLVETKGDDRDNLDSVHKIELGNKWETDSGNKKYKYFMVFNNPKLNGAKSIPKVLDIIGGM